MKAKSLFSFALCFLGIISVTAALFKIGSVEYDTLVAAVDAVPVDESKTTPKTGDSIISYVMVLEVSLMTVYLLKNKKNA